MMTMKEKEKTINVKIFINGSIQMTGCKHLSNIRKCLEIVFEKLKRRIMFEITPTPLNSFVSRVDLDVIFYSKIM